MNLISGLGWNNRTTIIFEEAAPLMELTPEQREQLLYDGVFAKNIIRDAMQKFMALAKSAIESGAYTASTAYRDVRLFFFDFLKEERPELVPQEFKDMERSMKSQGKTRLLQGKHINAMFKEIIKSSQDKAGLVKELEEQFKAYTENYLPNYVKGMLGSRGQRLSADKRLLQGDEVTSALSRNLSSFVSPEEKFESDIPEKRFDIEEVKEFTVRALEGFKESGASDDPFLIDSIDEIISEIEDIQDFGELEDYLVTKARKYLRISQSEDGGESVKGLSDILSDAIENFTHYNLYKAVSGVPSKTQLEPSSFEAIRDDVIYDIEDFASSIEGKLPSLDQQVGLIISKIKDMKSKDTIIAYLQEKQPVYAQHSNPLVKKLGSVFKSAISRIEDTQSKGGEIAREDSEDEESENDVVGPVVYTEVALTKKQKNNLLVECYRNRLRKKVTAQSRLMC